MLNLFDSMLILNVWTIHIREFEKNNASNNTAIVQWKKRENYGIIDAQNNRPWKRTKKNNNFEKREQTNNKENQYYSEDWTVIEGKMIECRTSIIFQSILCYESQIFISIFLYTLLFLLFTLCHNAFYLIGCYNVSSVEVRGKNSIKWYLMLLCL